MATVESLKTKLKTVDIKGKAYVEVSTRVQFFRDNYKNWGIETEIITLDNGVCVIKAVVRDENGVIKSTGTAYEKENSTFINKTSYIENCETSAIGRALGFLGIGIDEGIASREEVQNAMLNQETCEVKSIRNSPICPICHKQTTQEALNKWGMCSSCKQSKKTAVLPPADQGEMS